MYGKLKFLLICILLACAIYSTQSARRGRRLADEGRSGGRRQQHVDDIPAEEEEVPARTRGRGQNDEVVDDQDGGHETEDLPDDAPVAPEDKDYKYRRGSRAYEDEYDDKLPKRRGRRGRGSRRKYEEEPEYTDADGKPLTGKDKHHFDSKDFDDQEQHPVDEEDFTNNNFTELNTSIHNIRFEDLMTMNCGVEKLDKGVERMVINFTNIKFPKGVTFLASLRSSNELWNFDIPPTAFSTNKYYYVSLNKTTKEHQIVIPTIPNNTFHEVIVRPIYVSNNIAVTDAKLFKDLNPDVKGGYEPVWDDLNKRVVFRTGKDDDLKCNKELLDQYDRHQKLLEQKKALNETLFTQNNVKSDAYHKLRKHTALQDFSPTFLNMDFRKAILKKDFHIVMTKISKSVYKFSNVFTAEFLKLMKEELGNARQVQKEGLIQFTPPNTMHKDGFVLAELGMDHVFDVFFHNWIVNITSTIPPFYNMCGDMLDGLHAFVMRYTPGRTDSELSKHIDQSEVTLNICLHNDDPKGSGVVFKGIRDDKSAQKDEATVFLKPGEAVLHVGQNWHHTTRVEKGEKIHLILWFKSTYCRESAMQVYFNDCDGLMAFEKEKCEMGKKEL